MITGPQCRAARALVEWPAEEVARRAAIDVKVLLDFESKKADPGDAVKRRLLEALEEAGAVFIFENGGVQISYERDEAVVHSRVGDPVRICLVELPKDCPPGDERGKIYRTTNLRTGKHWEMPDSQHMCGGA